MDDDDPPGESVVLPLSLLSPNWARAILKNLTRHNQHYHHIFHEHRTYQSLLPISDFSEFCIDLADAVLLDVLSEEKVCRVEPVSEVGFVF